MTKSIDRKTYLWSMLFLFIGIPILEWISVTAIPEAEGYLNYVNTGCLAAVAIFTGWRLADAGYRRWVGVVGVMVAGVVGPIVSIIFAVSVFGMQATELPWSLIALAAAWVLVLVAFVIWAGTRRSMPSMDPSDHPIIGGADDDRIHRRIEPRF